VTVLLLGAGAGLLVAAAQAASPLTVLVAVAAPFLFALAGRGLPDDERRTLQLVLGIALVTRVIVIAAMFLAGLPKLDDLSVGALTGDESYNLARALRGRDIIIGAPVTYYDYVVATETYGQTSYLSLLSIIQVIFGPTPYGMRVLNALLFLTGATLLFRIARPAFGFPAAIASLGVLLFLPSLLLMSVSLLKEPLYFLVCSVLLAGLVHTARSRRWQELAVTLPLLAASLWILNDLRRGALPLALVGIALGLMIRFVGGHRWRVGVAAGLLAIGTLLVTFQPDLRARAIRGVETAARLHAGHVFTVGHAYKLMDEGFYVSRETPGTWEMHLTPPQALRFLVRAAVSFVVTPWPWEIISIRELIFLPEQLVWYLIIALLPFGIAGGWRRDPWLTAVLVGYTLPIAATLAVTTGNVGTLVRLRGLVSPHLLWLSVLGFFVLANHLLVSAKLPTTGRRLAIQGSGESIA
jgi:hypothetical protein